MSYQDLINYYLMGFIIVMEFVDFIIKDFIIMDSIIKDLKDLKDFKDFMDFMDFIFNNCQDFSFKVSQDY